MPHWNQVGIDDLNKAMNECDHVGGIDNFRREGFSPAKKKHIFYNGRGPYEVRSLIAFAFKNKFPAENELQPLSFENNNGHNFLARLPGFELRAKIR